MRIESHEDSRKLRVVKLFGLYHLLVALPLALPVVSSYALDLFGSIHNTLSLPGAWPVFDPTTMLFINLFGTLAFFWGFYRFRHPSRLLAQYEGWAMVAFALIVIWSVWNGASALWLQIAIVDGIGAWLHLRPE